MIRLSGKSVGMKVIFSVAGAGSYQFEIVI